MFCSKCGNQIDDNDKFCKHCGVNLSKINEDSMKTENIKGLVKAPSKKKFRLVALIFVILCAISSYILINRYNYGSTDFGQAKWGMSIEQIQEMEKGRGNIKYTESLIKEEDTDVVSYSNAVVNNYPGGIIYRFRGNKLVKGIYFFDVEKSDIQRVSEDCTNQLNKKYNKPYYSDKNNTVKTMEWKNSRTDIILRLTNSELTIEYIPIDLKKASDNNIDSSSL